MTKNEIAGSLNRLKEYIEQEHYAGFDPYDALNSPFFNLPFLKSNKLLRFGIQQLVKRSPFNLRPLLRIKKGVNPVTLGLCIQGYTEMAKAGIIDPAKVTDKCESLINQLENLIPGNFHGACWGYDFPWEARQAHIPAYQPTVVATGIITNALFNYFQYSGNKKAIDLCYSASKFVLSDLNQSSDPDGSVCFSYSPFDNLKVFNASMKAARLLIQVYHVTGEQSLLVAAEKTVRYVIKNQNDDGSWYYSGSPKGNWIDNYHTGYILDCLEEFQRLSGNNIGNDNISKGIQYYTSQLFHKGFIPKFFVNRIYPLDCTSAAQSILTLCRFGHSDTAVKTASYTINAMQSSAGYFYFRKYLFFTEKHSFMRWSNAWMFAALSTLSAQMASSEPPK